MRLWYLSHRPSLFAHMKYGSRRSVNQKSDIWSHWTAAHARLKNMFTEDEKCRNLMRWLINVIVYSFFYLSSTICSVV